MTSVLSGCHSVKDVGTVRGALQALPTPDSRGITLLNCGCLAGERLSMFN